MEMLLKRSLVHLPQCLFFTIITLPLLEKYTIWQVIKVLEQDLTHLRDLTPFLVTVTFKEGRTTSHIFLNKRATILYKEEGRREVGNHFPNGRCGRSE